MSQKYGNSRTIKEIEQLEFENLKREIASLKLDVSHQGTVKIADLLDYCYDLDTNAVPPVYYLKEHMTIFKDEVKIIIMV